MLQDSAGKQIRAAAAAGSPAASTIAASRPATPAANSSEIRPDTVSAAFTTVSGLAALFTVIFATRSSQEQRRVRQAERQSRRFEMLVLKPVQAAVPAFIRQVSDLMTDGTKELELFRASNPKHDAMLNHTQAVSDQFDKLFYEFKGAVNTALASWPDRSIADSTLIKLNALQDQFHHGIQAVCTARHLGLPSSDTIQDRSAEVVRALIEYDIATHNELPPKAKHWWSRAANKD